MATILRLARRGGFAVLALSILLAPGSAPAAAVVAGRLAARIPGQTVHGLHPLIVTWGNPLKEAFGQWEGSLDGALPGGGLIRNLVKLDFADPATQRTLIPLLRSLAELGVPVDALAEHPQMMDVAADMARDTVEEEVSKRAVRLLAQVEGSDLNFRLAQELIRKQSAYSIYLTPETKTLADRATSRIVTRFRDARRRNALEKLKQAAENFRLYLHNPEVMDWVLREDTSLNDLLVSAPAAGTARQAFTSLPDPEDPALPKLSVRRPQLARAPPEGAGAEAVTSDEELERSVIETFRQDNPGSSAVEAIESERLPFAKWAAGMIFDYVFMPQPQRGEIIRHGAFGNAAFTRGLVDVLDYADEIEETPRALRFVEDLARIAARTSYRTPLKDMRLVPNPLKGGEYWDLATGPHGATLMRNGLDPDTKYRFFDISPFVAAYLEETRRLMAEDGDRSAENIEINRMNLWHLGPPKGKLSVIRAKNIPNYVNGFERKYPQMAEWLDEGGKFVIPIDPAYHRRMDVVKTLGPFIDSLVAQGWRLEFSFAGERLFSGEILDHIVLTKPKKGKRLRWSKSLDDFRKAVEKRGQPFPFFFLR